MRWKLCMKKQQNSAHSGLQRMAWLQQVLQALHLQPAMVLAAALLLAQRMHG
jgi:hypothetical protein